jgi:multidrug efflux system membrane fusion protein
MRPLPVLTALLVVAALYMALIERDALLRFVGLAANATTEPEDEPEATRAALVRVVALRSRAVEIDSRVVLRGETQAMRMVEVRAETSGRVVSPPLRSGAFVTAGDVLCQLDPGTREAELEQARAALAEAEINNRAATRSCASVALPPKPAPPPPKLRSTPPARRSSAPRPKLSG